MVGVATGWAIANERPALVNLHTTAGLGNAVGALATARVNRAPLVVLVGQQDRRHLALEPFLTGRLEGLAGDYPVWVNQPATAQDVPGADRPRLPRGGHRAWPGRRDRPDGRLGSADDRHRSRGRPGAGPPAGGRRRRPRWRRSPHCSTPRGRRCSSSARVPTPPAPARRWSTLVGATRRPVRQEAFGARAGFPQDHPNYAGPAPGRPRAAAGRARRPRRGPGRRRAGVPAVPLRAGPLRRGRGDRSSRSARTRRRCTAAPPTSPC